MPKRSCPSCYRRLPYAARRCRHCEWSFADGVDPARARAAGRRRGLAWLAVLVLLVLGGVTATRHAPQLADWYAGFAARHLPGAMSSFAPSATDRGAFFYCARQVSREMEGKFSVETFPSLEESDARLLGEGRYRIESFVDEAREDGEQVRRRFTCTVRYERGRWALEDLRLEQYATAPRLPPARGNP